MMKFKWYISLCVSMYCISLYGLRANLLEEKEFSFNQLYPEHAYRHMVRTLLLVWEELELLTQDSVVTDETRALVLDATIGRIAQVREMFTIIKNHEDRLLSYDNIQYLEHVLLDMQERAGLLSSGIAKDTLMSQLNGLQELIKSE